jgi:AcrR family transcriptional regulator
MTTPHQRAAETKRARTREKAIKAVEKLLRKAKDQMPLPRMEDIAAVADVGAATLYKTFGSRDQLLVEAFKDLVLRPMDEEVERLNKVPDLQPVQKLTFYFIALNKAASKGRWRLFQAANHSRIDIPPQGEEEEQDPDADDLILTTLEKHIESLGPQTQYATFDTRAMIALRLFDMYARGGYMTREDLMANDVVAVIEATQLAVEMRLGKIVRLDALGTPSR